MDLASLFYPLRPVSRSTHGASCDNEIKLSSDAEHDEIASQHLEVLIVYYLPAVVTT